MKTKKRKLLYALAVLLFLLTLTVIGWLAYILFSFRIAPPPTPAAATPPPARLHQPGQGPVSEAVIEAEGPAAVPGEEGRTDKKPAATTAGSGRIPCICEGYGPNIQARPAHANPVTHVAAVSPTRVTVTITIPEDPGPGPAP